MIRKRDPSLVLNRTMSGSGSCISVSFKRPGLRKKKNEATPEKSTQSLLRTSDLGNSVSGKTPVRLSLFFFLSLSPILDSVLKSLENERRTRKKKNIKRE